VYRKAGFSPRQRLLECVDAGPSSADDVGAETRQDLERPVVCRRFDEHARSPHRLLGEDEAASRS
jgi:hypothetical protein